MSELVAIDGAPIKNHGWRVVFAGLGINLALGVLYSWSVISAEIAKSGWGWSAQDRALPYSVACLVFCLVMVPAGRMQDKFSPRLVATIGGILVGIGMIVASRFNTVNGYVLGFGVLAGAGIGCGYASATPPAVKWFPPAKTGMVAGIVVAGFGLASVYAAPLSKWLAATYGLQTMMMSMGIGFLVVVVGLGQLLKPPHKALQFVKGLGPIGEMQQDSMAPPPKKENFTSGEMLHTWQFYALWFMYACGAGAGLMIISCAKKIVAGAGISEGLSLAAVMGLAVGNGGGRVVAGMLSDRFGRNRTMLLFFLLQACSIVGLYFASVQETPSAALLIALAALVGANYGSNLALFPSVTKDFFGLKNFGMNYGLVFTAWGIGGFILAQFAARVYDGKIVEAWAGSYKFAFYTSAALLVVAGIMTFMIKPPQNLEKAEV